MTNEAAADRRVRVLVVDDDEDTSYILALHLERAGYRVGCAPSVREARNELRQTPYAVMITDLNLPDGDGFSLLEPERPAHLLVALLLTGASDAPAHNASAHGFDGLLVKPFDGKEMLALIERLLARASASNEPLNAAY